MSFELFTDLTPWVVGYGAIAVATLALIVAAFAILARDGYLARVQNRPAALAAPVVASDARRRAQGGGQHSGRSAFSH